MYARYVLTLDVFKKCKRMEEMQDQKKPDKKT
jgi:hypothetical protein